MSIKVANNHAYIVSEAFGHGMQVFDLMKLGYVTSLNLKKTHTTTGSQKHTTS